MIMKRRWMGEHDERDSRGRETVFVSRDVGCCIQWPVKGLPSPWLERSWEELCG